MNYCYINGKILPFDKAKISPNDMGMLRGYGVFGVMKTVNGRIFLFEDHFRRLNNSANYLGVELPLKKHEIEEVIVKLILKNKIAGGKEASIRIVLTGGISEDAMHFDSRKPTFYILVSEFKPLAEDVYKKGIKLGVVNHFRDISEIKTTNYIVAVKNINERQKRENFFEIIYVYGGTVLEASTSNFFVFMGDKLIAPKDGILKGITRGLVIDLAKKEFEVEERELKLDELKTATEAFIAATNKDIVPVVKVGDIKIGNGKPGKNTKRLMEIFGEFVKNY